LIGKIFVGNTDVNFKIVNKGLAWHYKKYQREQSADDRKKYSDAEIDAKLAVIGLWSEPDVHTALEVAKRHSTCKNF